MSLRLCEVIDKLETAMSVILFNGYMGTSLVFTLQYGACCETFVKQFICDNKLFVDRSNLLGMLLPTFSLNIISQFLLLPHLLNDSTCIIPLPEKGGGLCKFLSLETCLEEKMHFQSFCQTFCIFLNEISQC